MRLSIFIVLLLFATSVSAIDLGDDFSTYPLFLKEGTNLDVNIVVGEQASTKDIISASELAIGLQQAAPNNKLKKAQFDTKYSSIGGINIISIGSPCENYVSALIAKTSLCEEYFEEGKGYIELHENNGGVSILVAGLTPEDTYKAAIVLRKSKSYNLVGNAYEITGDKEPYTVTPRIIPELTEDQKVLKRPSAPKDKGEAEEEPEAELEQEVGQEVGQEAPVEGVEVINPDTPEKPELPPAVLRQEEVKSSSNTLLYIIIGVVVLAILIGIVLLLVKRGGGRKGEQINSTQSGYQQSARVEAVDTPAPPVQNTSPNEPSSITGQERI